MILLIILLSIQISEALRLSGGIDYTFDGVVYNQIDYKIKTEGEIRKKNFFSAEFYYSESEVYRSLNGISTFSNNGIGCNTEFGKSFDMSSLSLDLSTGAYALKSEPKFFVSIHTTVNLKLQGGKYSLIFKPGLYSGPINDNPVGLKTGVSKNVYSAAIGISKNGWETWAMYQRSQYGKIERSTYINYLADSSFFSAFYDILNPSMNLSSNKTNPIPENMISKISFYFYGPFSGNVYAGSSLTYENSAHSLYGPISDNETGKVTSAYFPYQTPQNLFSVNANLSYIRGVFSGKIVFPIYSRGTYRGYYQTDTTNLLAGFDEFSYIYSGLAPLTTELSIKKKISNQASILFEYSLESRPYTAYSFLGKNAYNFSNIGLRLLLK